jgi:hypothetical protein
MQREPSRWALPSCIENLNDVHKILSSSGGDGKEPDSSLSRRKAALRRRETSGDEL